ncbi:restriction endonuclease [Clavibacter zhangzhiyongii]|uniref:Restriction endonuclease n=1 Tax=Clavibacter zhangzhiyongii TaxID=2768071 RepID=A0A7L7Z0B7_9MICO|nr:restriction endonuclease [Clavibacter zhangzhiyongii]QOD43170.1 restriction endonuclease [Clavibacter zhangzhiyongii]
MTEMPTWEEFMIPTLRVLNSGATMHWREFQPLVADECRLTDEQKTEMLPSGSQIKYQNRLGWGVSFLTNVGGLERPKRGHYRITEPGRQLLQLFPGGIKERDIKTLGEDPSSPIRVYQSSGPRSKSAGGLASALLHDELSSSLTPIEQVQEGVARIREEVAAELLERLQGKEPAFFEQAVVDLLLAMGYGGTTGKGSVTQLSNDGGIDGVIDQDILGLSRVYIQAKRYAEGNTVARPDLQAFVGALAGKADRGIFITTSRFSDGARMYAENVPTRIILIDGKRLTTLMIRYGVGVQVRETYRVVELDEDFFA